jgi:hypothetical protein
MGVRVELEPGERVSSSMRRLEKMKRYQLGYKAVLLKDYFVPLGEIRRKKAWRKYRFKSAAERTKAAQLNGRCSAR